MRKEHLKYLEGPLSKLVVVYNYTYTARIHDTVLSLISNERECSAFNISAFSSI